MWELDSQESWAPKIWCFRTVVLEKTLESILDCKEIQPVNPKGNQPWIFIGKTDAEVETPILWPPDVKNWLIGKDPDTGNDWKQEEKGTTEDEMVGWHHWRYGHEFEQAPGVGDGQGSLACCSSWDHKKLDMAEQLNLIKLKALVVVVVVYWLIHVWLLRPQDCSLPGSSVHGILQARILQSIDIPISRGSSWPRNQIQISSPANKILYQLSYKGSPLVTSSKPHIERIQGG